MICLSLLTRRQRLNWISSATAMLRERQKGIAALLEIERSSPRPDIYVQLAHENVRAEIKARLSWLALARKMLA
jgi:hypothetical protein